MVRLIDEFRDSRALVAVLREIEALVDRPINLMEVCGTHTVSISRFGIRSAVPEDLTLLSGPGCPVCVTSQEDIDKAMALASLPGVIFTTFGDMMKVPGTHGSLALMKAKGADIRICYSTLDALKIAEENPDREVVFYGVGFETTAPTVALAMIEARARNIRNFSVFSAHKTVPMALRALLDSGEVRIDGFILPGHVSIVTGTRAYEFLATEYRVPGVVTGFEPLDVLLGVRMLARQVVDGVARIENEYTRVVTEEGNRLAQEAIAEVFEPSDAYWRGIGVIPKSGLAIRDAYAEFDAARRFEIPPTDSREPRGCSCGDILRGVKLPFDCALFGRGCTPEHPIGPCMVSSEGACAAYYRYEQYAAQGPGETQ